jgi:hypothetical protein
MQSSTSLENSRRFIKALRSLKVKSAYLDGELCALNADGVPVFSRLQAAMDEGRTDQLVFFAFDLLFLDGRSTAQLPLIQRKERLRGTAAARRLGPVGTQIAKSLAVSFAGERPHEGLAEGTAIRRGLIVRTYRTCSDCLLVVAGNCPTDRQGLGCRCQLCIRIICIGYGHMEGNAVTRDFIMANRHHRMDSRVQPSHLHN